MSGKSRALALILALPLALPQRARAEEPPLLELSLPEAVRRALENNVDIAVEKYNPESSALGVREVEGFYDPTVFSNLSQRSQANPATSVFAGAQKVETDTWTYAFGLSQAFRTGGSLRIDFNNSKVETNNVFSSFNPFFDSSFPASLTQPLLRNFRIDSTRRELRVAKKNREISDLQFRQTVTNTIASVKQIYYDILYAIDNLEAQKKSLALAKKLLEENKIKVRVGTMAPLDVVSAESEVASREETVIVAESALRDAEDALKRSIFPKDDPSVWALRIVLREKLTAEPMPVDVDAAVRNALEKRTDVAAARKSLEAADINAEAARNQTLPAVDLVASYVTAGVGGTQFEREGFGGPIIRTIPGGYGDALDQVFGRDFPTWRLGVSVSYPIRNRQAQAGSARARIARDQALASLRRLEIQVTTEVRTAARAVDTNYKRVESTRAARVLQVRRLDAEEKRFAAGMSTNFFVTQAQRDLALAEVAELRALADYQKSLVSFERVQEAGLGGSGSVATVSTGSAGRAASRQQTGATEQAQQ